MRNICILLIALLLITLLVTGCVTDRWDPENPLNRVADLPEGVTPAAKQLDAASTYAVMLQGDIFKQLDRLEADLLVIDRTRDGTGVTAYTPEDLARLKGETGGQVVSYLSIGEASWFRDYFHRSWLSRNSRRIWWNTPDWISCEDAEWPGSFRVKFWVEEWQQIVLDIADQIMEAGFDGVFLDLVDVFEYWAAPDCGEAMEREVTAGYMVDFVVRIANQIREVNPEAIVIVQNAEYIIHYGDERYLEAVDGLNLESLYYKNGKPRDAERTERRFSYIREFQDAGAAVFAIDYIYSEDEEEDLRWYTEQTRADGITGYPADEDLRLSEITPFWVYL